MNTLKSQKSLALKLLNWHGGQGSALYAVGSCMLSASDKGVKYSPKDYGGHFEALQEAIFELEQVKERANFPECVSAKEEAECKKLGQELKNYFPEEISEYISP